MGLPASFGRRRTNESENSIGQEPQSSGITDTINQLDDKTFIVENTVLEECDTLEKARSIIVCPRRRNTDDTLVGDEIEEDERCRDTTKKVQDKDKKWKVEITDCQMFEEPEEVNEK